MIIEELGEHAANGFSHFNRILQRFRNGIGFSPASFKEYSDLVNVDIHVHYGIRRGDNNSAEYCSIIKPLLLEAISRHAMGRFSHKAFDSNVAFLNDANACDEQPMLVSYVALMEKGEQMLRCAPVVVWLKRLQNCSCGLPDPICNFKFVEAREHTVDGEARFPLVRRSGTRMLQQKERPEKMIECTSSVVHAVPDHKRPIGNWEFLQEINTENVQPIFGLTFFGDSVGLSVATDSIEGTLQFVKVFLCPVEFGSKAV